MVPPQAERKIDHSKERLLNLSVSDENLRDLMAIEAIYVNVG
jgi:hypothetical protein